MGCGIYKILVLHLLLNIQFISSNKKTPSVDKFDECRRCKLVTDSFKYWLEKTSRGKFEGGDTAWEEAKLKSYARSEVRLVEIQEGLCSELKKDKDRCYALAEEAEHPIEKWWSIQNLNEDLYSWLCIDTLKYCCPMHHFGLTCEKCPLDSANKVCSGHGTCIGEGTRHGTGKCKCSSGFVGTLCESCANNYFRVNNDKCGRCHRACDGCSGASDSECLRCSDGWTMVEGACVDIDECSGSDICESNQFCVNQEGSHSCKICDISCVTCTGEGPSNCSSCEPHHSLWNGMCLDEKLKEQLLMDSLNKAALYFGLFIIIIFVMRFSKYLATIAMIAVAIFVYFSEKTQKISTFDFLLHSYL
ncbi:unnamed protein product [Plutella xylostella]|uniref:(diamondback moth) hypothetical protein n=1 Tax=Plutella xylostella TaxID=51655 RepID=A0A8S4DPX1_PLUXY|nr:unnamed protein product [Plutella xylostella]